MRCPSWSKFTSKLSGFEKEISENITKFKEEHSILDIAIKESLGFLPPPFNAVAQNIYDGFTGTEEEKSKAVIEYLKQLESKNQKYYEKTVRKLDDALEDIDDVKLINHKQTDLIQELLQSSEENQKEILEEFNKISGKLDRITTLQLELNETQKEMCTMLQQQNISTQIDPDADIEITKEFQEKIQKLEEEKSKLQDELRKSGEDPKIDVDLLLRESIFYFYEKDYKKSITLLDTLLLFEPNSFEGWHNRGFVLVAIAKYEEAVKSYDNAITKYEEAVKSYDNAIRCNPNKGETWFNRGMISYILKKYEEAVKRYDNAIRCNPNDQDAIEMRGITKKKLIES